MTEISAATIDSLTREMRNMDKTLSKAIEAIDEAISDWVKIMADKKKAVTIAQKNKLKEIKASTTNTRATEDNTKSTVDDTKATRKRIDAVKEQIKNETQDFKKKQEWAEWYESSLKNIKRMNDEEIQARLELLNEQRRSAREYKEQTTLRTRTFNQGKELFGSLRDRITKSIISFDAWAKAMQGIKTLTDEFTLGARTNISVTDGYFSNALKLGLTVEETVKMKKEFLLAAAANKNGMQGFMDDIGRLNEGLEGVTLLEERTKMNASLMNLSITMGLTNKEGRAFRFVQDTLKESFVALNKKVGMTGEEFTEMTNALLNDQDRRDQMLRLDENQRERYMRDVTQFQQHLMTTKKLTNEQAKSVQDFVKRLQGETYKDRLKKSLKMQAMAGIMGIKGGEELAAEVRKGPLGDQEKIQEMTEKISKQMEGMRGMGPQGELMVDAFNASTEGLINEMRVTNTTLSEGREINEKVSSKVDQGAKDIIMELRTLFKQLESVLKLGFSSILIGIMAGALTGMATRRGAAKAQEKLTERLLQQQELRRGRNRARTTSYQSVGQRVNQMPYGRNPRDPFNLPQQSVQRQVGARASQTAAQSAARSGAMRMGGRAALGFLGPIGAAVGGGLLIHELASLGANALKDSMLNSQQDEHKKRMEQLDKKFKEDMARIKKEGEEKKKKEATKQEQLSIVQLPPPSPEEKNQQKVAAEREKQMTEALQQLVALQSRNNDLATALVESNDKAVIAFKSTPMQKPHITANFGG